MHRRLGLRYQNSGSFSGEFRALAQQLAHPTANRTGHVFTAVDEGIERCNGEIFALCTQSIQQSHFRHGMQIEDVRADGHASARRTVGGAEDAKGQILDGKI